MWKCLTHPKCHIAPKVKAIEFFGSSADRVKSIGDTASIYYLRSPEVAYNSYFRAVGIQGDMSSYMPSNRAHGICPCISI